MPGIPSADPCPPRGAAAAALLTFFLLGAASQVGQVLLGREFLVVFYGSEMILGLFFGAWLLWIGLGGALYSALAGRIGRAAGGLFPILAALLPAVLLAEVFAVRLAREALGVSAAEVPPLGAAALTVIILSAPLSVLTGFAFPLGCRALAGGARRASWGYAIEAAGALAGGIAASFFLIQALDPVRTTLAALALLGLNAAVAGAVFRRRIPAAAGGIIALAAAAILITPAAGRLDALAARARWDCLAPGLEILATAETPYQSAAVGRRGPQWSLLLDGKFAAAFPDPQGAAAECALAAAQCPHAKSLLLVGGAASDRIAEWARYPLERIDCIQDDPDAFALARAHLPPETLQALSDPRVRVLFEDGRRLVNRLAREASPPRYDLIILALPDPSTAALNRYYTREAFEAFGALLAPRGVVEARLGAVANYLGAEGTGYLGSIWTTLRAVFPEVEAIPGEPTRFFASRDAGALTTDPQALKDRFLSIPLARRTFPATGFWTLVEPDRIASLRARLDAGPALENRDLQPITHYLGLLFWGRMSSPAVVEFLEKIRRTSLGAFLLGAAVLLLFRIAYVIFHPDRQREVRSNVLGATAALGFAAMALEMLLLLVYQGLFGSLYQKLGLLNGVFMFALAAGALAARSLLGRLEGRPAALSLAFTALLAAGAGFAGALPALLERFAAFAPDRMESILLGLVAAGGMLTGAGFPLAVALSRSDAGDTSRSVGWIEAADHLGGALGGLLAGTFLLPLLGARLTALAASAALGAGALLALRSFFLEARPAPAAIPSAPAAIPPAHAGRRGATFPWVGTSWSLAAVAAACFVLSMVLREAPRFTTRFEEKDLQEISGSKSFRLREDPFPHYLGWSVDDGPPRSPPPESASLATVPIAPDIKGFGGPINLLASISKEGKVLGVRLIESEETPTYIQGIDGWLGRLRGLDVTRQLDLGKNGVDALTGATVTSEAIVRILDRVAVAVGEKALAIPLAPGRAVREPGVLERMLTPKAGIAAALLLLFFPVYLWGGRRWRLGFLLVSAAALGFASNTLVTFIDIAQASRGHFPPLSNSGWWVLAPGALLVSILFGQAFCGYLCPFGAVQELVSELGDHLCLRARVSPGLERAGRYVKYILLAFGLSAFWLTGSTAFVLFTPMDTFFSGKLSGWMLVFAVLVAAASLAHFRFFCRYLCPVGAFFALFNRIAILGRLGPVRRFSNCDLGSRGPFDLDCIRCSRCAARAAEGAGSPSGTGPAAPGFVEGPLERL